mmetsp:Transcript_24060/g.29138  ORF Transcript_24060/g.29138 Transcript_24060/m.29138 type:complete len:267 (+) Transcript_24060:158-958(+)
MGCVWPVVGEVVSAPLLQGLPNRLVLRRHAAVPLFTEYFLDSLVIIHAFTVWGGWGRCVAVSDTNRCLVRIVHLRREHQRLNLNDITAIHQRSNDRDHLVKLPVSAPLSLILRQLFKQRVAPRIQLVLDSIHVRGGAGPLQQRITIYRAPAAVEAVEQVTARVLLEVYAVETNVIRLVPAVVVNDEAGDVVACRRNAEQGRPRRHQEGHKREEKSVRYGSGDHSRLPPSRASRVERVVSMRSRWVAYCHGLRPRPRLAREENCFRC